MRHLFVTNAITDDAGNVLPGHAVAVYGTLADAQAQTSPVTDLLDADQAPVTSLVADDYGNCMFYGPDGTDVLYADSGHGLILLTAADAGPRVAELEELVAGLSAVRFVQSQDPPEDTTVVWLYDTGEAGPTTSAEWPLLSARFDYVAMNTNPVEPLEPVDVVTSGAVIEQVGADKVAAAFCFYKWDIEATGRPYTQNLRVVNASTDGTVLGTLDVEIPGGTAEKPYIEGYGQPGDVASVWDLNYSEIVAAHAGDYLYVTADVYSSNDPVIPDYTEGRWVVVIDVSGDTPALVSNEILYYTAGAPANWAPGNRATVIGLDSTRVLEASSEGLTVITLSGSGASRGTPVFATDMDTLFGPRLGYAGGVGFVSWQDGDTDCVYWPFTYAAGTVTLGTRTNGPLSLSGTDYGSLADDCFPYVAGAATGVFYDVKAVLPGGGFNSVVVKFSTDGDTIAIADVSGIVNVDELVRSNFYGGRPGHPLERGDGKVDVLWAHQGSPYEYRITADVFGAATAAAVPYPNDVPSAEATTAAWAGGVAVLVLDWLNGDNYDTSAFLATGL